MDGPITPAQKKYFYYNFRSEFDDYFDQITKFRANQFISDAERIYGEHKDPVERRRAWQNLANQLKSELVPLKCSLCHKPTGVINNPDYCNC